jgi:HK97 family phage prohead protease
MNKKNYTKAFVEEKLNDEERILEAATASTGDEDRDEEFINPSGWDLENFKRNPVLQWAHDYTKPPIGKVLDIKVVDDKLIFKPQFAKTTFATEIWELFKGGFLNAFSVGFKAQEKEGNKFLKQELLEISAVPVPSNPNALVLARSKGLKVDFLKDYVLKPELEETEDYIHIRIQDPENFIEDSFKTIDISEEQGIKAVIGKLKSDPQGSTKVQKYLFDKEKWDLEKAQKWVDEHKEEKEIKEIKEGRILSEKNKDLIKQVISVLENLLEASKSIKEYPQNRISSKVNFEEQIKGRDLKGQEDVIEVHKALQLADKAIEIAIKKVKEKYIWKKK